MVNCSRQQCLAFQQAKNLFKTSNNKVAFISRAQYQELYSHFLSFHCAFLLQEYFNKISF